MLPAGDTLQAQRLHEVWLFFAWSGLFVYALTGGLILWALVRYRRKKNASEPPQFKEHRIFEVTYTVIPLLMACGLFAVTYGAERSVEHLSPNPALTVNVTGYRWSWRFEYPAQGIAVTGTPRTPPELVLPFGETTRVNLTSSDVIHAFWIPAFLFKRDAVPGYMNHFDLTPKSPGLMLGECAEFCGLDHALMRFTVRVVSAQRFAVWANDAARHSTEKR